MPLWGVCSCDDVKSSRQWSVGIWWTFKHVGHSRLDEYGYDNCVTHSFKVYFYLEDNCFTMLCWFLPCYNVNQPQVDTCPLPLEGIPSGSVGTEIFLQNAGDPGSVPGWGRSPGEENGTHSSILAWRISMDRRPWRAIVHGVPKSQTCKSD